MRLEEIIAPLLPVEGPAEVSVGEAVLPGGHTHGGFVVGCPPADRVGAAPGQMLRRAILGLRVLRVARRRGLEHGALTWPAGSGHRRGVAATLRSSLMAGSVHWGLPPGSTRIVDTILAVSGVVRVTPLRIGSGGGLRMTGEAQGDRAVLRMGRVGSSADPSHHYAGLVAVSASPAAPPPLGRGEVSGVAWTVEGHATGRTRSKLDDDALAAALTFLGQLPSSPHVAAPHRHAAQLAGIAGGRRGAVGALADLCERRLENVPARLIHGDFWLGNLLFAGSRLTAVLDWDGWDAAGAPGTDLLHLLADLRRRKARSSYGQLAGDRFWRHADVRGLLASHLGAVGLSSNAQMIDAVGVAWWLTAVGTAVARNSELADDANWVEHNVRRPAAALAGSIQ